jgi:hypothetical protein
MATKSKAKKKATGRTKSELDTDAAEELAKPGKGSDDVVGTAKASAGGDATFEGDLKNGTHTLVLKDMKHKVSANPFKAGEEREQIVWLFAVKGKEKHGLLAWYTSYSLHEKSKFPPTCESLEVKCPTEGEPIKKSNFIGKSCEALIKNEKGKKDASKEFPRIKELFAA